MQDNKYIFEEKARKLAEVEGLILTLADYSPENPANYNKQAVRPTRMFIWLGVAAVGGLLYRLLGDGDILSLALGAVFLIGLIKTYLEWNNYHANHAEENTEAQLTVQAAQLTAQRKQLIEELNQMQAADTTLAGIYWWNLKKNPSVDGKLLPGRVPNYRQWQYALLSPVYLNYDQHGIYLEDMKTFSVLTDGNEVRVLLTRMDVPHVVLYRNEELLNNGAIFKIMKLYAYSAQPIEEIVSTTIHTRIDKAAQLEAYRRKLDQAEIALNALGSNTLMTNREMYLTGRTDDREYEKDELHRELLEAQRTEQINAQGDYDERTIYRKAFRDLYRFSFLCCADVYISVSEKANGIAVAITVPRTEQSLIHMTVRTPKDVEFGGRLESYAGQDAVTNGDNVGKLSIQMAVDWLMHGNLREMLQLQKRDILAPRPNGLDDYEWPYLIWQDQ